ncbi:hypothetical protein [Flavobacterium macrobrachii]|uniref:HD domain-containing protein n=1 Tax=Flavobacterium macrobrachii TaxID=591204 RepID=A0ABS2CTX3_9FLAO|nr:hypothetical protein [Flavobacterium macrobrachii]MBM6498341.1 hypothetical protein [Flavobacterium macrobrachii]
METLLHLYKNLDSKIWDYYDGFDDGNIAQNPFIKNPNSAVDHQQFIKDYFRLAGKKDVLQQFNTFDVLDDERAYHTNSVFLLGLLIREKTILKTILYNEKRSKIGYPIFPFLWFLSVLFHDFGMKMEENLANHPDLGTIDGLLHHYDIKHSLLVSMPKGINANLFGQIERYYSYRNAQGKIDHGILGGIYLYDRLVKIRRFKSLHRDTELNWHYSLEKRYALAAAAVACHNIWTKDPDKNDTSDYELAGLHYLIRPNFEEISLENFPLLFLFGIIDTIDPIKLYMKQNKGGHLPETILDNIKISFGKRWVKFSNRTASPLDFQHFINQVKGLEGWISVETTEDKNQIKILFR